MKKIILIATTLVGGCGIVEEFMGGPPPSIQDSQAIGASCRQTGRSLEECFSRNPKADKGAIFNGWKEMNEYMANNNLKTLPPLPDPPSAEEIAAAQKEAAKQASEERAKAQAASEPDLSNDPEVKEVLNSLREIQQTRPVPGQREADRLLRLIQETSADERLGQVSSGFPSVGEEGLQENETQAKENQEEKGAGH